MVTAEELVKLQGPVVADAAELAALRALAALLADDAARPLLLVGGEREAPLPPTLLLLVRHLVDQLMHGRAVGLETFGPEVTIREAAAILGDSVEQIRQLVADGKLASREADSDQSANLRTIPLASLLAFLETRSKQRREALRELTRLSEEMGGYDLEEAGCLPS